MLGSHEAFTPRTNRNAKIWRYLDLAKFLSIVSKRNIYFARADRLGNPFEGSIPLPNAENAYILEKRETDPAYASFNQLPE
jgi:hypothetical protein